MNPPSGTRGRIAIFEDDEYESGESFLESRDGNDQHNDAGSGSTYENEEGQEDSANEEDDEEDQGSDNSDLASDISAGSTGNDAHDALSSPHFANEQAKPLQLTRSAHEPSGSFSTTSGIHIDDRIDPHLDYIEPETPTPGDENTVDPFSYNTITPNPNYAADPRKVSESVSTLPEELEYYRSPLTGRSPLALAPQQGHGRSYQHTPSKMAYPPGHSRSNSVARHDSRPPFRSPSSVRAMQMSSPPPFADCSPLSMRHKRHLTNGSQGGSARPSPRVRQSNSPFLSHSPSGTPTRRVRPQSSTPSRQTSPPKSNQEFPLVLLHCTLHLLGAALNYPATALEAVGASERVKKDVALLKAKLDSTVTERGVLIPHPGEDYELLEERVMETLELQRPRIGTCGHIRQVSKDSTPETHSNHDEQAKFDGEEEKEHCADCARHIDNRILSEEEQAQRRRWDVRVYAANGLMRAGAWNAAWREMEKVDVEVGVWLGPEDKDLPSKLEQWAREQEAVEDAKVVDANSRELQDLGTLVDDAMRSVEQRKSPASTAAVERPSTADSRSSRHRVPFPGTHTRVDAEGSHNIHDPPKSKPARCSTPPPAVRAQPSGETPLATLFVNYLCRLAAKNQHLLLPVGVVLGGIYIAASGALTSKSTPTDPIIHDLSNVSVIPTITAAAPVIETVTETVAASATAEVLPSMETQQVCSCNCDDQLESSGLVSLPREDVERLRALEAAMEGTAKGLGLDGPEDLKQEILSEDSTPQVEGGEEVAGGVEDSAQIDADVVSDIREGASAEAGEI